MNVLVALVILLSCGPPRDVLDCRTRCNHCEPSCVNTRGSVVPEPDEECDDECNVDNTKWGCAVQDGECVVVSG